MLTKYGKKVLTRYFALVIVAAMAALFVISNAAILSIVLLLLLVFTGFMLNFFRDPRRTTPGEPYIVIAPADGKVVAIRDANEPEYLKTDAIQVSIFMSPVDVHVNRFPISGTVEYFRYVEGEFGVAFADKSSERNERTHIGIGQNDYKVLFKQIAGAVARRIIAHVAVGQQVRIGEAFGMIQFGSRVDVLMPHGTEILVKRNDRTIAGETILARFASLKKVNKQ